MKQKKMGGEKDIGDDFQQGTDSRLSELYNITTESDTVIARNES